VLQQEHKKLAAKTPKKTKKARIILVESSDGSKEDMSVDHMTTISKTGNDDSPSNKLTDKTDKTDKDLLIQD
jgi:tRNA1(Val) A37 N6-methylase TrmN6